MKKIALILSLVLCFGIQGAAQTLDSDRPGRIIVKFKPGTALLAAARAAAPSSPAEFAHLAEPRHALLATALALPGIARLRAAKPDAGLQPLAAGMERIFIADLDSILSPSEAARLLSSNPEVEYAEPDYVAHGTGSPATLSQQAAGPPRYDANPVLPNDPFFSGQWALQNTAQDIPLGGGKNLPIKAGADINAPAAWSITTGLAGTILAVLDTGIIATHPEFSGRLVDGWNYVDNAKGKDVTDDHGHGTAVAGVAAAKGNNSALVAGINWNCRIMPVKVIDKNNSALYTNLISGLQFAADNGAQVINLSLAGAEDSQALRDAVTYASSKGAIVVASMGNDNKGEPAYPAAFSNVIAVGATGAQDQRAAPFTNGLAGSNYGAHIDFVAPGDYLYGLDFTNPANLLAWFGTSVAAPMVSGTISLMLAVNPGLNFDQVMEALKAGARDQVGLASEDTQGWDKYYGWGRIDAYRSLLYAQGINLFSHVAIGGGWTTVFTFLNTGSSAVRGTLTLTKADGSPLSATLSGPSAILAAPLPGGRNEASSLAVTVPAGGVRFVTATGSGSSTDTGWARLETVGSGASGGLAGGVGTFQYAPGTNLQTIAGILAASTVQYATIPVNNDDSQKRYTGYAVANPGPDPISLKVVVVDQNGSTVTPNPSIKNIELPAGQQTARFLWQDSSALLTFKGSVVLIEKDGKRFSVVALVQNQGLYTAIPVIPSKAPTIN